MTIYVSTRATSPAWHEFVFPERPCPHRAAARATLTKQQADAVIEAAGGRRAALQPLLCVNCDGWHIIARVHHADPKHKRGPHAIRVTAVLAVVLLAPTLALAILYWLRE